MTVICTIFLVVLSILSIVLSCVAGVYIQQCKNLQSCKNLPENSSTTLLRLHSILYVQHVMNTEEYDQQDKICVYVINLSHSTSRWKFMMEHSTLSPIRQVLSFVRVEAVDGMIEERSEEKQTKKINGYTVHYPNYAIADNTKIIACSMSHLIAIRQAYQNGMDVCVIAEDDVSFLLLGIRSIALEFQKIVRFVKEEKTSCIVSLFQPTGATGNPHSIMIDGKPSWGTQGYIINRIGMERVCTTCFQKDHLLFLGKNDRDFIADYLIYSLCEKVYTVSNSMVYPFNVQKDMVSSLHPEHTNFHIKEAIHAFAQNKHHLHTLSFGDF